MAKQSFHSYWQEILAAFAIMLLAYYLLGIAGLRTAAFWLLLYIVPGYLILTFLGFDKIEAFIITAFLTAGVLPALVFFLNFIVPSLRWSAVIIFALEVIAIVIVYKYARRQKE